jgi:hypothetical protein
MSYGGHVAEPVIRRRFAPTGWLAVNDELMFSNATN